MFEIGFVLQTLLKKINHTFVSDEKMIEHITKTCPVALSLHPDIKQVVTIHF